MTRNEFMDRYNSGEFSIYEIYDLMCAEGVDYDIQPNYSAGEEIADRIIGFLRHHSWEELMYKMENISPGAPFYLLYRGNLEDIYTIETDSEMKDIFLERMDGGNYWDDESEEEENMDTSVEELLNWGDVNV